MNPGVVVAIGIFSLAAVPALLYIINERLYRHPPAAPPMCRHAFSKASSASADQAAESDADATVDIEASQRLRDLREMQVARQQPPRVSLLIPARNEAATIAQCLAAAQASEGVDAEILVLDDHSEDKTASIVRAIAARDPRVQLHAAPPLPEGWCGKQHACWHLSRFASHDLMVFIDSDVRLERDGLARIAAFLTQSEADLASGIPRQITGTFMEKLLLPLIHFILLGYLPLWRMRASRFHGYGAGCGQLFATTRAAYLRSGGHRTIRHSLHDGVSLPRAYRRAGLITDLFDATSVASCRMYNSNAETWRGLAKNATEGMASPVAIWVWSVLLLGGHVLPWLFLACGAAKLWNIPGAGWMPDWMASIELLSACSTAVLMGWAVRLAAARRFDQPRGSALLHTLGILLLMAIQFTALGNRLLKRKSSWRGRSYAS